MNSTIARFDCPHCQQSIETDEATARRGVNCPGCFKYFIPEEYREAVKTTDLTVPKLDTAKWETHQAGLRREKIRSRATSFEVLAMVFAVIGLLALLFFGFSLAGDAAWTCFYVFSGCLGAALWLYVVAQIIHIRANTDK